MGIDQAASAFADFSLKYNEYRDKDLSESDTRSKLVDELLISILGWDEREIRREGSVDSGYYDYVVSTATFQFVVEAKRNFAEFNLPKYGKSVKLSTLEKGNKDEIDQVRRYVVDKSLTHAILTNGHQIIIAKFVNTDGKDWRDNTAVIFRNVEDIGERLIELYNLAGKDVVQKQGRILEFEPTQEPKIILAALDRQDQEVVRNALSAELFKVIDFAFREIVSEDVDVSKDLLESCYVKNDDIRKYNSELKTVFEDNPPEFDGRIAKVRNTENTQSQLEAQLDLKNWQQPSPIVLIGGKGVGKTTFIKYFYDLSLSAEMKNQLVWIHVDFRTYTRQLIEDTRFVAGQILKIIDIKYPDLRINEFGVLKEIYASELNVLKKGIWAVYKDKEDALNVKVSTYLEERIADTFEHLKRLSVYIAEKRKRRVCIVFDNGDQLDEAAQKQVFLLAHSMHKSLKTMIIVALREGYFYRWRTKPPFDAYTSSVFHISAAPYREVLRKRFDFLANRYEFPTVTGHSNNNIRITIPKDALPVFFRNLEYTLFSEKNSEVMAYLEETSYPNIRLGLDQLVAFLLSGHTKVSSYALSKDFKIPIWEFVKSVALEASVYYHGSKSKIFNIFYPCAGSRSHFLKLRLIKSLLDRTNGDVSAGRLYPVRDLVKEYVAAGFSADIVLKELSILIENNLVDTESSVGDIDSIETLQDADNLKVTYAGAYYLSSLVGRFCYLDLVQQDTPIYQDEHYYSIREIFPEADTYGNRLLDKRFEATVRFYGYLKAEETAELRRISPAATEPALRQSILETMILPVFRPDMERLQRVIDQHAFKK